MDATSAAGAGLASFLLGTGCLAFVCFGIFYLFILTLALGSLILWVLMLIDAIGRRDEDFPNAGPNVKLIWILVIVFGGGIGALVYFIMVYRVKREEVRDDV